MALRARHGFIAGRLAEAFGVDEAVCSAAVRASLPLLNDFLGAETASAPSHVLAYYQPKDSKNEVSAAAGALRRGVAARRGAASRRPEQSVHTLLPSPTPPPLPPQDGEWVAGTGKPELFFTMGDAERLRAKAVYLLRVADKVDVDKVRR
jgi:hypothetical protein